MSQEFWAVVYIENGRIRCTTSTLGLAAQHLTGGTTYNREPQPTEELAIREAMSSAAEFRRNGYGYERCWQRGLGKVKR